MVDVLSKKFGPATVLAHRELQTRDLLPQGLLRAVDDVAFPTAVLALAAVATLAFRRRLLESVCASRSVFLGFVLNCALSAFVSGVYDRLQGD
jgi:hypothetical protein